MEIALLVIGAFVGVLADRLTSACKRRIDVNRQRKFLQRRADGSNSASVRDWLSRYYGPTELYRCTISGRTEVISLLVDPNWIFEVPIDKLGTLIEEIPERHPRSFQVKQELIDLRRLAGQKIFNNLTYYVTNVSDAGAPAHIQISQTDYFSVITNLITLEEEVFDSVRKKTLNAPVRNLHVGSLAAARKTTLKPLSFGVAVGLVLKIDSASPQVVLHTRSSRTVTHGGSRAVFPSFGLAPIGTRRLAIDQLVYLNFIKEYLEEGYAYDELVNNLSDRRANSQWFMSLPEAIEIDAARQTGTLKLLTLGYGIDCLSGTGTLALLAEVSDEALATRIRDRLTGNWEVAESTLSSPSLELVPITSTRLARYLATGELHPGSAFTIERIQHHYGVFQSSPLA